jgi:hypothetical protein
MLKRRGGELSLSHTQCCAVFDHIRLNSAEFCCKPHWASFGRVWPRGVLFEWSDPLIAQQCAARGRAGVGCVATDAGLLCSRDRAGGVVGLCSSCPPACSYFKFLFSGSAVATGWAALLETIFSSLFSLLSSLFSLHSSLFILHSSLFSLLLYSPLLLLRLLRNFQCLLHGSALGCVADASGLGSSS